MRTTVDIEEPLLRKARKRAAESNRTLSRLVSEAVRAYLAESQLGGKESPFQLITAGVKGRPAPTPERIGQVLDQEESGSLRLPRANHEGA